MGWRPENYKKKRNIKYNGPGDTMKEFNIIIEKRKVRIAQYLNKNSDLQRYTKKK
jgi:hypothetical protein